MIISIHIPKTAGTTFGAILRKKYGNKFLYVYNTNIQGKYCIGQTPAELDQNLKNEQETAISKQEIYNKIKELGIECIHGHFFYSLVSDAPEYFDDVRYVTWVREPEARTYSDYLHFMRNGWHTGDREHLVKILANRMGAFIGDDSSVFSFIGRTEFFDQDLKRFGINDEYQVLNVTPETDEDVEIKQMIKGAVDKDRELYNKIISML